jgi:hypothetical protein
VHNPHNRYNRQAKRPVPRQRWPKSREKGEKRCARRPFRKNGTTHGRERAQRGSFGDRERRRSVHHGCQRPAVPTAHTTMHPLSHGVGTPVFIRRCATRTTPRKFRGQKAEGKDSGIQEIFFLTGRGEGASSNGTGSSGNRSPAGPTWSTVGARYPRQREGLFGKQNSARGLTIPPRATPRSLRFRYPRPGSCENPRRSGIRSDLPPGR